MDRRTVWAILLMMVIAIVPRSSSSGRRDPCPAPRTAPAARPRRRARASRPRDRTPAPDSVARRTRQQHGRHDPRGRADRHRPCPLAALYLWREHRWARAWSRPACTTTARSPRGQRARRDPAAGQPPARPHAGTGPRHHPPATTGFSGLHQALDVAGPTPLRLTARAGRCNVDMTYTFVPTTTGSAWPGRVTGVGPTAGSLLVGMGPTLANTEADSRRTTARWPWSPGTTSRAHRLHRPQAGRDPTVSGPFDWVAIKSKYFVTGLLAYDSTGGRHQRGPATGPADHREATHRGRRPAEPAAAAERRVPLHRLCGADGVRPARPASATGSTT